MLMPARLAGRSRTGLAGSYRIDVQHGQQAAFSVADELTDLAGRCGAPTTARTAWLRATVVASDGVGVWSIVARDSLGVVVGAVVLRDAYDGVEETTTLLGTDGGQRGAILATDMTIARVLAAAVGDALSSRRRLPSLDLGPIPAGDDIVDAFARGLGGACAMGLEPIPVVRQGIDDNAEAYLSPGMRRTLRKAGNRLDHDGRTTQLTFTTDPVRIVAMLPELERHHRDRDHEQRRPSDLDDDEGCRLWHARMQALAQTGELELARLEIDGQLAAYVLGIVDAPVYRLGEGRFVTSWARYSPGRLLEAAVLQRVLDDPDLVELDWMTAVAPDALLASNGADPMVAIRFAERPLAP